MQALGLSQVAGQRADILENAIRDGKTELVLQHSWDSLKYQSALTQAISIVSGKGYTVDQLVCGQDYNLYRGSTSVYSGTTTVTIKYLTK